MVVFHSRVIVDQRVGALKNWEVVVDEFQRENVLWKKSTNEVFVDVEHVQYCLNINTYQLGGGFKYFSFSSLPGEDSQF